MILEWLRDAVSTPGDGGWFYSYQSLIAGVLALTGAWMTVRRLKEDQRATNARFQAELKILKGPDRRRIAQATPPIIQSLLMDWSRLQGFQAMLELEDREAEATLLAPVRDALHNLKQHLEGEELQQIEDLTGDAFESLRRETAGHADLLVVKIDLRQIMERRPAEEIDRKLAASGDLVQFDLAKSLPEIATKTSDLRDQLQALRRAYDLPKV